MPVKCNPLTVAKLMEILENVQDGFLALDRAWRVTYASQPAAEALGLHPEDLIGQSLWEREPHVLGTPIETYYRRAMAERVSMHFQTGDLVPGKWFEVHVVPSAE